MRCDADAMSFAFTGGEGADRPNRSPSSNFGKAPALRRQDQERGSFLPSAAALRCAGPGAGQLAATLRYARRHGISRGIDRIRPRPRAAPPWPCPVVELGGSGKPSGANGFACYRNHERCTFSCSSLRPRPRLRSAPPASGSL